MSTAPKLEAKIFYWRKCLLNKNEQEFNEIVQDQEDLGQREDADIRRIAHFRVPKHHVENWTKGFVTQHQPLMETLKVLDRLAYTNDTVLLRGETGVGKDILAQAMNPYREGQFLGINCAALPSNLIESELFGHMKGAFTGATEEKPGLFRECQDGTLFLDEVFELPMPLQAKMLRVLETRRVRAVGSTVERPINCRIVAASCRMNTRHIREDFHSRLGDFEFVIPPLRERQKDIPFIMQHICPEFPLELLPDYNDTNYKHNVRTLIRMAKQWSVLGRLL